MDLVLMICNRIDRHQYQDLEDYFSIIDSRRTYRKDLDKVIEWNGGNPKDYKNKDEAFNQVKMIVCEKCNEAKKLNGYI